MKVALVSTIWINTKNELFHERYRLKECNEFDIYPEISQTCSLQKYSIQVMKSFLLYHLSIGFNPIFLYMDGIKEEFNDIPETIIASLPSDLKNTSTIYLHYACENISLINNQVHLRQEHNAQDAMTKCLEDSSIKWLLHLDIDELFYWKEGHEKNVKVTKHFQYLIDQHIDQFTYVNHEGIPEQYSIHNYFTQVTKFRQHHSLIPLEKDQQERIDYWRHRTNSNQYLIMYDNGKSAVRTHPHATIRNVHEWNLPLQCHKQRNFIDPRDYQSSNHLWIDSNSPCILHYPLCGIEWMYEKYTRLGDFNNTWTTCVHHTSIQKELKIPTCLHTHARDLFQTRTSHYYHQNIKQFYQQQIMMNTITQQEEWKQQVNAKVCLEITFPSKLIQLLDISLKVISNPSKDINEWNNFSSSHKNIETQEKDNESTYSCKKAWLLSSISQTYLSYEKK